MVSDLDASLWRTSAQHVAFLVSVQHTASRSALNAIRSGVDLIIHAYEQDNITYEGTILFDNHMVANKPKDVRINAELMAKGKNIYTVRDPLSSMITTLTRNKGHGAQEHVNDWLMMCSMVDRYEGYPIRLEKDPVSDIQDAFTGLDLYDKPLEYMRWNATAPSALRIAYKAGDWNYLRVNMKYELTLLQSEESVLRPWFEKLGYTDLMWWS